MHGGIGHKHYQDMTSVTWLGVFVNLILSIAKIFSGIIGYSQALIADGVHSLSDLVSDGVVLVAASYSRKGADAEHPYGHGRIETFATIILGLLLAIVAIMIVIQAGEKILSRTVMERPTQIVIWVALISIISKEALYQYTKKIADRINSNLLRANAWHHRSDAISSVIVLLGIIGAWFGFLYLDAAAAIIVAIFILKIAYDLSWPSISELIDTGLDKESIIKLRKRILEVHGVRSVHQLRTRQMAGRTLVDVHVIVASRLSVSEGHYISDQVEKTLLRAGFSISDVVVHVDPENDEVAKPSSGLMNREQLLRELQMHCVDLSVNQDIVDIKLHYLQGSIEVEIWLPINTANSEDELAEVIGQYQKLAMLIPDVSHIKVLFVADNSK